MDVDKIFYIFGSFSRKKDKRKSLDQTSISAGNSPLHIPRPVSQNLTVAPRLSAYGGIRRKSVIKEWECGICRRELVEPRLLGCLHSFCTRCLQGLHQEGEQEMWSEVDGGSIQLDSGDSGGSGAGSVGSGYESDLRHSGSDSSYEQRQSRCGIYTRKISGKSIQFILCPKCGHETQLPFGGISALPLNYILLRKLKTRRAEGASSVLCDLCTCDKKAESRCSQCLVSVCTACEEAHSRQKATSKHAVHPLEPGPKKYCSQHPRAELTVYCATCQQVICRDCCVISHTGHALASAARAAAERVRILRDACERARHVPDNVEHANRSLNLQAMEVDTQAAQVEAEVQSWAEQYKRAVEAHGRELCTSASRVRARYRLKFGEKQKELDEKAQQAREAVKFTEELLSEAKEDELLSISGPVLRRLEKVTELSLSGVPKCELRLAPLAPASHDVSLVGRLFTRAADADRCILNLDGLQDLRVDCPHEAILELRDSGGERIWCGGEQVAGYYRRGDSSARPGTARVTDRGDGTYSIVFVPPTPGAYLLAVTLNNKPIKGSPFPFSVRVAKKHIGQYHCCSFCSSGGKRDVTCGCGSSMGGGYKGCGHGHAGHPGSKHWSCCGSTQPRGPCTRTPPRPQSQLYHISL